ncbi:MULTISPECIES: hypothetical protein [Brucella/Ochrobactrum group]|uniref:hypothetical protein n=1 Tax=Brucella/Ochrobactrum group TaxID=2826938 RepID=UPI0011234C07|nr:MULTISPECIES: hypothetical protein [Brucella/Ochrobactrum group]
MPSKENLKTIERFEKLSSLLRDEQFKLLDEAASEEALPGKSILRQIAELELNITAIENSITDLKAG